jgi:hypothetical protein
MRVDDLEDDHNIKLRQELTVAARGWQGRAWRMQVVLAHCAKRFRRTGVRTDRDAELMTLSWYRLQEAIYNLNLIKQALIGL